MKYPVYPILRNGEDPFWYRAALFREAQGLRDRPEEETARLGQALRLARIHPGAAPPVVAFLAAREFLLRSEASRTWPVAVTLQPLESACASPDEGMGLRRAPMP